MAGLRVLIVDDEEGVRIAAQRWLNKAGFQATAVGDGTSALTTLVGNEFDVVLTDVRMPGMDGLTLLKEIRAQTLCSLVIMMSAFGDSDDALEAIRLGAYDYIAKPFKRDELLLTLRKAEEREQLVRENTALKETLQRAAGFENIIARSDVMHEVFRTLRKVAGFNSTVLIQGESGTGKELIARAIHVQSQRRDHPFVAVNCGAIPDTLLESELFGHVKGAFTDASHAKAGLFEEAHRGTLLLDEIGELPLPLQVKLLRVLQEGELRRVGDTRARPIDVRVIAAGIDDLGELVKQGEFREDLFYRLNVIPIHLPPLRERRDDIPLLTEHFLERNNQRLGTRLRAFSADAMQALCDYHWPGNVRQLQNIIERAMVLSEGSIIELSDLPPKIRQAVGEPGPDAMRSVPFLSEDDLSIKRATRLLERYLITRALQRTQGNRTKAAKLVELSHRALLYKIKDYELQDVK